MTSPRTGPEHSTGSAATHWKGPDGPRRVASRYDGSMPALPQPDRQQGEPRRQGKSRNCNDDNLRLQQAGDYKADDRERSQHHRAEIGSQAGTPVEQNHCQAQRGGGWPDQDQQRRQKHGPELEVLPLEGRPPGGEMDDEGRCHQQRQAQRKDYGLCSNGQHGAILDGSVALSIERSRGL